MDYSVTFARHFSRLVWLLLHETGAIGEQKAALRALVTISKDGPVTFATQEWRLVVNGSPLPEALTGVQDLAAQLIGHAVKVLRVDQGAAPADLLGVARILTAEAAPGASGQSVAAKLQALGAKTVHVESAGTLGIDLDEHTLLTPEEIKQASSAQPNAVAGAPAAAPSPGQESPAPHRDSLGGATADDGKMLMFSAIQPQGSAADLFGQIDGTRSTNVITRALDELVTLAEAAAREGKSDLATDVFYGIVRREAQTGEGDTKRAYVMAIRRMSKPTVLRAIAQMLPRRKDREPEYTAILLRTGEDGADALIEQLTGAQSLADRRAFFDVLVHLNAGVPALIHMLGDARWYVARNAADLLGEMQAPEAEVPLVDMLKHDDDRVRRAAATALAKLGTPKAVQALHTALRDHSPQVRLQAAAGLSSRKGQKSATTLAKALDEETDAEVQFAILGALGRLATGDAVQKLVKAAEPESRLFKKKPVAYRVHAVQALGQAGTNSAIAALQALVNDKEKEVREAVVLAVMQSQRGKAGPS